VSGGGYRWFKRSTGKKRSVTGDNDDDNNNNNNNKGRLVTYRRNSRRLTL
jgi:hypothetical protein